MTAITDALRITRSVRLDEVDPASTPGFDGDKLAGRAALAAGADHLSQLQERLFAASKAGDERSVLLVVQGMDTAGKGGIMRHVLGQVDPQGVKITSFKAPTDAEKRHDFLWRFEPALPKPGMIAVFDRSHYEDVLIHRVRGFSAPDVIQERYGKIVEFERGLVERGITVVKVMLHVSFEEQGARLLERLDRPDKHWKYNPNDVEERTRFPDYMEAYQIAINRTARAAAPWNVVPADPKWYARLAVQELLVEALEGIDPQWPEADFDVAVEREKLIALGGAPPTEEAKAEAKAKAKAKEKQAKKDKKQAKAATE
ncbi:MAG: PPK2 family polyphosphate kinase [Actinomycetes bacterium]